ncbi:RPO41 Mitochondrial DNA-directed RNA polymerase [uncultured Caudovirales phage]|uniref:DNA-directed RNA polymerase n=1 Tax=uncultured Caudovirales phage TaxID=2100421 RepID=A0A6J5P1Q9_9CAUD|nr:RPO41 Mitochondrial DNA-directed RNA polymerase [uncultured Caudovirales phage]
MSDTTIDVTLEAQIALEIETVNTTREAWEKATAEAQAGEEEADTDYGTKMIKVAVAETTAALDRKIKAVLAGRPGRPNAIAVHLKDADVAVLAYIGLRAAVDGVSQARDLMAVAIDAGSRIEDQFKLEAFKKQHPDLFKLTIKRIDKQDVIDRDRRRTVMKLMANRAGVVWKSWTQKVRVDLGIMCLEAVKEGAGIIDFNYEATTSRGKTNTRHVVTPTSGTMEFMVRAAKYMSLLSPRFMPTIIRPKRWTNPRNGGYWSGMLPLTLVKTPRGKVIDEMANRPMPDVYSAINRMQETGWRINTAVLEVLNEVSARNLSIGGLPPMTAAEIPSKPFDIETNEQAKKEWKAKAATTHASNKKQASKRLQVLRTAAIAERFKGYEAIYFPHQLDFRGRAYAVPMFLNPQGPDYCKALLTFTEGKAINDGVAAGWLAIHGANLAGVDKVSLDERIKWIDDNQDAILATAADPWSTQAFWCGKDKPWQFLAFCFEWAAFQAEGYGYVSSLPIALDGSCNGLQHYSAALRDPIGGKATNLIPNEKPSDIYGEVGTETKATVLPLVQAGADPGTPAWFAAKWIEFGIDRKITKRAVMTLPYGSTIFSCREFVEEALRAKLDAGLTNPFMHKKRIEKEDGTVEWVESDGIFDASLFLQGHVWQAIGRVVKAAVQAMGWLRSCAKLAAEEELPVMWSLPDGFLVSQIYPEMEMRRIKTILEGVLVQFRQYDEAATLDKRRMANGIAPNFVHSLDACALRAYVNLAFDNGITAFGLVHDSYATVAADAELMSVCIRESFAHLYENNDVLEQFRGSILAMLSDERAGELNDVPPKGDLDLSLVRESDFFFA